MWCLVLLYCNNIGGVCGLMVCLFAKYQGWKDNREAQRRASHRRDSDVSSCDVVIEMLATPNSGDSAVESTARC